MLKMCKALNISIDYLLENKKIQSNNILPKIKENNIQEYSFGDIKVTLSKNGKITDKDMLDLNQFLIKEKILNEDSKN